MFADISDGNCMLGIVDFRNQCEDYSSPNITKVGGSPVENYSILNSYVMVAQIYAPTEVDRSVYIFCCTTPNCSLASAGWQVIRNQLKIDPNSACTATETVTVGTLSEPTIPLATKPTAEWDFGGPKCLPIPVAESSWADLCSSPALPSVPLNPKPSGNWSFDEEITAPMPPSSNWALPAANDNSDLERLLAARDESLSSMKQNSSMLAASTVTPSANNFSTCIGKQMSKSVQGMPSVSNVRQVWPCWLVKERMDAANNGKLPSSSSVGYWGGSSGGGHGSSACMGKSNANDADHDGDEDEDENTSDDNEDDEEDDDDDNDDNHDAFINKASTDSNITRLLQSYYENEEDKDLVHKIHALTTTPSSVSQRLTSRTPESGTSRNVASTTSVGGDKKMKSKRPQQNQAKEKVLQAALGEDDDSRNMGKLSAAKLERKDDRSKTELFFQKVVSRNPKQVLRYAYQGRPLWCTAVSSGLAHEVSSIPRCKNCGSRRVFEMQLMPAILSLPIPRHAQFSSSQAMSASTTSVSAVVGQPIPASSDPRQIVSEGIDFGVVCVFSCPNSCSITVNADGSVCLESVSEICVVQPPPDVNIDNKK